MSRNVSAVNNKLIASAVLATIIAANALAWLARPTATPAYPADIFPEQVQTVRGPAASSGPDARKTARPQTSGAQEPAETGQRLTLSLELEPEPLEIARQTPLAVPAADASPDLLKDLQRNRTARPQVPKLKLFDPEYGTRGVTTRRWVSDRLGLEAGVGLTDGETLREREAAAGVGVVISFD